MPDETLRNALLDAVIDGEIGRGLVISTMELKAHFGGGNFADSYLSSFLANSEMGALTAGYRRFTLRVGEERSGVYQIHPVELLYRMRERGLV